MGQCHHRQFGWRGTIRLRWPTFTSSSRPMPRTSPTSPTSMAPLGDLRERHARAQGLGGRSVKILRRASPQADGRRDDHHRSGLGDPVPTTRQPGLRSRGLLEWYLCTVPAEPRSASACRCLHPRSAHLHYRRGSECSLCPDCRRYRPAVGLAARIAGLLTSRGRAVSTTLDSTSSKRS
jgi:hypothetical protein